ncbi:hypothetical protein B0H34DRAFT_685373 [Crassisporium funariophilum]|nr:hypothetical protein B0H34DRAFT_685373 [Crassisporium funariophilum]
MYAFIVIVICLEHSFWLAQKASTPLQGFIKALDTVFQKKPVVLHTTLKDYLKSKESDDWFTIKHHPSPIECADIRKIIFDNLLCRP